MQIRSRIRKWNRWVGFTGLGLTMVLVVFAALPRLGQSSPIPGLSASLTATGTLLLTVTNAVANEYYTIYTKPILEDTFAWSGSRTGALGVSNFTIDIWPALSGFYKAEAGFDRDGDGIPNWED